PARFGPGQPTDALVTNMDVTATMLDAAGISVPEQLHSRSVLPVCEANARGVPLGWPDAVICEHNGHGEDILQRICVTGRFKYVAALYDKDELYDLREDPYELRNLVDAPAHAAVAREMRGRVIAHLERVQDPFRRQLLYALRLAQSGGTSTSSR
ncbi:MAG: sulfatase/phosphatase domain-containing protein, partial [Chloroflexota bacterium]